MTPLLCDEVEVFHCGRPLFLCPFSKLIARIPLSW
nr:MAG TPA: hypothetical protein [Caudoviricetes sp.]